MARQRNKFGEPGVILGQKDEQDRKGLGRMIKTYIRTYVFVLQATYRIGGCVAKIEYKTPKQKQSEHHVRLPSDFNNFFSVLNSLAQLKNSHNLLPQRRTDVQWLLA